MKVVMVEPGQYARAAEIGDELESMQAAVDGLIDCAYPWREKVCIVCNDEGLINGMPVNRAVERYGVLAGPFFHLRAQRGKLLQPDGRTGAEIPADVPAPADFFAHGTRRRVFGV